MGLDDFVQEEKTSSVTNASGPESDGVNKFIEQSQKTEVQIEGGFTIDADSPEKFDTELVKVFGGPGTGKTTTIVGNTEIEDFKGILQRMFEEYSPHELLLIAYTRAAADEAKDRLTKLTDVNKGTLDDRITTIHSLAMGENNLRPKDIVEIRWAKDKYNFCQEVGMEYNTQSNDDPEDMMAEPEDEGHLFFQMNSWLKSSLKPPEEWGDCPLASNWERDGQDFVTFANAWDQFKNEKGIWEFDDAILQCVNDGVTVDADYLFVDEVQDLYPLQQAFLDNQFGAVKRIFLAGDDDQTIYEWAGARPQYFLDMEGKINNEMPELWDDKTGYWESEGVYILDQSWRMPNTILELAKQCIYKVDERQEKSIKPHHEGGNFVPLRDPESQTIINLINHDDTMILFRARYQIGNFSDTLIEAGIPYEDYRFKNSSYGTWNKESLNFRDGMRAIIKKESHMTGAQASRIITEMPDTALVNREKRKVDSKTFSQQSEVPTSEVVDKVIYDWPEDMNTLRKWLIEFEELNWYQERAVRNNLQSKHIEKYPEGLTLTTIHGSKGKEADTIILSLSTTNSVVENMPEGEITDAERRLYYVGMTRTENTLVMAEGMDRDSPTITIDTILGKEWREHYGWANSKYSEH